MNDKPFATEPLLCTPQLKLTLPTLAVKAALEARAQRVGERPAAREPSPSGHGGARRTREQLRRDLEPEFRNFRRLMAWIIVLALWLPVVVLALWGFFTPEDDKPIILSTKITRGGPSE